VLVELEQRGVRWYAGVDVDNGVGTGYKSCVGLGGLSPAAQDFSWPSCVMASR